MPITRTFFITCDKCGRAFDRNGANATDLRAQAKEARWSISGNRFTCTLCNGREVNAIYVCEEPQAGDLAHRPE
jgi:hypothetical protein